MRFKNSLAATTAAMFTALAAAPAHAAVTYSFTALSSFEFDGETATGSYSFTVADFIDAPTTIALAHLSTCSVTTSEGPGHCLDQSFKYHVNGPGDANEVATLDFFAPATAGTSIFYYFAPGSFEHVGTYDSIVLGAQQAGTLTVSLSAVPEPSSLGLMAAGLGLLGVALRRARRR
jgi:hypothetical protein